jgi:hypothetical protein
MVFRKVKKETPPTGIESAVQLILGGFYSYEKPENPKNALYCLYPSDPSGDPEFLSIAKDCMACLLNPSSAVINQCHSILKCEIQKEKLVQNYLEAGGTPTFPERGTVLTFTSGIDQTLLDCIPEQESACYELTFYGFESILSSKSSESNFTIKINYHEEHDFLQIETKRMTDHMIEHIQQVCKKHGRTLVECNRVSDY